MTEEIKKLVIALPKMVHKSFRTLCFDKEVTMKEIITEFLERVLKDDEFFETFVKAVKEKRKP